MNDTGRGDDANPGNIAQAYLIAGLAVDQQVLDIIRISAKLRTSPDHDVEHLLLLEQAADSDAADQRRSGTANIAGLEAVCPGFIEVNFDIDRLLLGLWLDLRVLDAFNLSQGLPDLFSLGLEDLEVL